LGLLVLLYPLAVSGGGERGNAHEAAEHAKLVTRVSKQSLFRPNCDGSNATQRNYENGEVEPWLALDPSNPRHLVGVYQQDRWHGAGAHGIMAAVTRDSGATWTLNFAHFDRCEGGSPANGGNFERDSDPWITISPDGTVYQSTLSFDRPDANEAVLVSRSKDGGNNWSEPDTLLYDSDPTVQDDEDHIAADPTRNGYAYAIWSRYVYNDANQDVLLSSPVWLSSTKNGGATWEAAHVIYTPPPGIYANGHGVFVLSDGTLVIILVQYDASSTANYVIRSSDHGQTWSSPVLISEAVDIGVIDVKTGELVREGIYNVAVNPTTGQLYMVWMDARFSGGARNGIVLSTSSDGGLTWSAPVQVNQAPHVQAFAPGIAVTASGRIAVTYYDFRNDNSDHSVLLTNYWRITSQDGGRTWDEIPLSAAFDLRTAPYTSVGYMVTDYEGIVAIGEKFMELFVTANSGNSTNPTDVFATTTEKGIGGQKHLSQHVEVNFRPRTLLEQRHSRRESGKLPSKD
jgi:hypothetical protein